MRRSPQSEFPAPIAAAPSTRASACNSAASSSDPTTASTPYAATASAFALLRTRPRTVWPSAIRANATAPPIKPFAPVTKICILALPRFGRDEKRSRQLESASRRQAEHRDRAARAATQSYRQSYRPNRMYLDSRVIDDRARALQAQLRSAHRSRSWRRSRESSPSIWGSAQFARGKQPLSTLQALVGKCMEWDATVDGTASRYGIGTP